MSRTVNAGARSAVVERTVRSRSVAETRLLAARLGANLVPGQVIALHGDLGAGKTTFIQGLAAGLGIAARVTSPTFILVAEYDSPRRLTLIHMDVYRLSATPAAAAAEAETFGIEEILARDDAVFAVEWAERLAGLLPADVLHVELARTGGVRPAGATDAEPDAEPDDERVIRLVATGARSTALVERLLA
jgi:tRNA threonylcarbamoyladenosine biosynthesis protein TsaE